MTFLIRSMEKLGGKMNKGRILVTGAAGFVGSKVSELLLEQGNEVVGMDNFLPNLYSSKIKRERIKSLTHSTNFTFHEFDLRKSPSEVIDRNFRYVINLAAMPGLVKSWSETQLYMDCNVMVLGNLLEHFKSSDVEKFVQISTSSVYGKSAIGSESGILAPFSPYGVSKLAAEKLLLAYNSNFDFRGSILRYFSVYGPGQRPDMAYFKIIDSALHDKEIEIYGDGFQSRTNTFVDDIALGTIQALDGSRVGEAYNLSGSSSVRLNEAIDLVESHLGKKIRRVNKDARPGDQRETRADISKARSEFNYSPNTAFEAGIIKQIDWQRGLI